MQKTKKVLFAITWIVAVCISQLGLGQRVVTEPEMYQVGIHPQRLARVDSLLSRYIENGWIPGAVALVAKNGKVVYHKALGYSNLEKIEPLDTEHIFRLASMTKPVTSVALMMLYEEGKFTLDDPVERYIPEFANAQVAVFEGDTFSLQPAERKVTVRDLLTHTAGIGYGFLNKRAGRLYHPQGIPDAFVTKELYLADKMKLLAATPLLNQPGARWRYGLNTDMVGYLVEVLSGQSLADFMHERIFEPLGMDDTYFFLPNQKAGRLVPVYGEYEKGQLRTNSGDGQLDYAYPIAGAKTYFSGGSGLVSTAEDYFRFAQMLLNGGNFEGRQLLSPMTVQLMTRDQLRGLRMDGNSPHNFGLGFRVATKASAAQYLVAEGRFGWDGYFKTTFWVDPRNDVVAVLLTNVYPSISTGLYERFEIAVNQALLD